MMLKPTITILAAALCLFFGCATPAGDVVDLDGGRLPYRFSEREFYANRNASTHFVDLDGDGIEARIAITYADHPNPSSIVSTRYNGTIISSVALPPARSISCEFAQDINNDGFKELFLVSHERDTLYLTAVDVYATGGASPFILRFPLSCAPDTLTRFSSSETIRLHGLMRGAGGDTPLIVGSYASERTARSSGLFAYGARSGTLLWRRLMGPKPALTTSSLSASHDQTELFFGTTSTGTPVSAGETDDGHTYMIGLRQDGAPLWKPRLLGGAHATSRVFHSDVDGQADDELVCFFSSSNRQVERSYLKIFNPANGAQIGATREFKERIILGDELPMVTRSQRNFFVVCTFAGTLSLLDENLRTALERRLPAEAVGLQVRDVLGDEEKEIIVILRTDKTVILDAQLTPLALVDWSARVSVSRCNAGAEPMLVLENGRNVFVGSLIPASGVATELFFWAAVLAGAALLGYAAYRSFFYIKIFRTSAANSRDIAIVLLNGRGKVLMANGAFCTNICSSPDSPVGKRWELCLDKEYHKPLRDLCTRAATARASFVEQVELFTPGFSGQLLLRIHPVYAGTFRLGTFMTMHDITKILRSDQLINWAKVAHSMAHEMKTPLSTIWFTLARIRQEAAATGGAAVERHLESIEEEVRRVDNYLKGFMKLANINPPNTQPADVSAAVAEILDAYTGKLPETTAIETDLARGLPLVSVDVHLFTVAMRNLLDNSVTAMKGRGVLKVSTYLVRNLNNDRVYLTLSDTGGGIAEEDIPKVFQPYFTKTEGGTGLGLVITKKIVEDHEGSISFSTRPGYGTEFVIQFPVPAHAQGGSHAS